MTSRPSSPLAAACPACFPGDAPAALPAETWTGEPGTVSASYRCLLCDTSWITRWVIAAAWQAQTVRCEASPELDRAIEKLAVLLDGEELEVA